MITRHRRVFSAIVTALLLAGGAEAQNLVIVGAKVYTMTGPAQEGVDLVVKDGRIDSIGSSSNVGTDVTRIDGKGLFVYPGFIGGFSQIGLVEVEQVDAVNDTDENTGANTAQIRALDAYNPLSSLIPVSRVNGVTAALSAPSTGNVFTGQGAVVVLDGGKVDDVVLKSPASLHVVLGEGPKGRFGGKDAMPSTRMGIAAYIREQFYKAGEYRLKLKTFGEKTAKYAKEKDAYPDKLAKWKADSSDKKGDEPKSPDAPDPVERDLQLEVLVSAMDGKVPTFFHAQRLDDLETALRLAEEFGLQPVIVGGASAYKIAPMLAEKKVPVILTPTEQPDAMEAQDALYQNAALLRQNGVQIAFSATDATHNLRNLPYEAGLAVSYGLPYEDALRALTIDAAKILRVDDQVGSLEAGKLANFIVTDGDPLQPLTHIKHVVIKGVDLPLTTRQTELAKQYGAQYLPK